MGFFSKLFNKNKSVDVSAEAYKLDNPIVYKSKEDNGQLQKLENMLNQKKYSQHKTQIENDILRIKSGDYGENQVRYYLTHSYMPMYILHDVYLEYDSNNKSQIDFLVITRKMIFVIECKNFSFSSSVRVGKDRQFIVKMKDNTMQSIKNPLEQNRIHIEVINKFFPEIRKICFPLVVFTNENSILDYSQAPDDIKNHIVRADNLVEYIKSVNNSFCSKEMTDFKMRETADCFLKKNQKNSFDYTAKYSVSLPTKPAPTKKQSPVRTPEQNIKQEIRCICPNCRKPVSKGFYFCKCGMQFTIYGTKLSDEYINSLINGKSVKCNTDYGIRIVYPQIEKREFQGKTFIQWKSVPTENNK